MAKKRMAYTINALKAMCEMEIEKGNGDKHILISNDDEGNGYHELFFSFTETKKFTDLSFIILPFGVDEKTFREKYIILG